MKKKSQRNVYKLNKNVKANMWNFQQRKHLNLNKLLKDLRSKVEFLRLLFLRNLDLVINSRLKSNLLKNNHKSWLPKLLKLLQLVDNRLLNNKWKNIRYMLDKLILMMKFKVLMNDLLV